MVNKYDQLRAQNRITNEEAASLSGEKNEVMRLQSRMHEKMTQALERGQGLFRGVSRDASALGKTLGEILKKLFDSAVPDLYPKLEMGVRDLKGTEAEEVLKAANLSALPQVFYGGEQGLNLVIPEDAMNDGYARGPMEPDAAVRPILPPRTLPPPLPGALKRAGPRLSRPAGAG